MYKIKQNTKILNNSKEGREKEQGEQNTEKIDTIKQQKTSKHIPTNQ